MAAILFTIIRIVGRVVYGMSKEWERERERERERNKSGVVENAKILMGDDDMGELFVLKPKNGSVTSHQRTYV